MAADLAGLESSTAMFAWSLDTHGSEGAMTRGPDGNVRAMTMTERIQAGCLAVADVVRCGKIIIA